MAFVFRRSVIALLLAGLLAACGGKKKSPAGPDQPGAEAGLWSLAPAEAVAGVVIQDGALAKLHGWMLEGARIAEANPATRGVLAEARREMAAGPVDPFDADSIARAGIDLGLGLAIWVDPQERLWAVLPITDRAAFVGLVGGRTEVQGEAEVDVFGDDMSCQMREGRYLCAPDAASLTQLGAAPENPLAEQARGLPPELRGEVLMVLDSQRYELRSKVPGLDDYLTNLGALAVAAQLGEGTLTVRGHLPGALAGRGQKLASAPSVLAGKVAGDRPSGVMRARLAPGMVLPQNEAGEKLPGGLELGDLFSAVTGELVAMSHAGTNGSFSLQIGLASTDAVRQLVQLGCGMAPSFVPGVSLKMEGDRCRGTVKLDNAPPELRAMLRQREIAVDISVEADRLDFRVALGEAGPKENVPGPGGLGNELIAGEWNVAMWGEGLSPIYFMELFNFAAVPAQAREPMKAGLWLLGHIYEAGAAVGFREDGLHAVLQVTSFAAAGDDLYREYEAALAQAVNGNFAGASSAMDALAQKAPESIVARQVALKSGAWIGAFALGGAAWATLMARSEPAPPPAPPAVAPPAATP